MSCIGPLLDLYKNGSVSRGEVTRCIQSPALDPEHRRVLALQWLNWLGEEVTPERMEELTSPVSEVWTPPADFPPLTPVKVLPLARAVVTVYGTEVLLLLLEALYGLRTGE